MKTDCMQWFLKLFGKSNKLISLLIYKARKILNLLDWIISRYPHKQLNTFHCTMKYLYKGTLTGIVYLYTTPINHTVTTNPSSLLYSPGYSTVSKD